MIRLQNLKRINYRHYLCIAITIAFVIVTCVCFKNSILRLWDSLKDLFYSICYYFSELFGLTNGVEATVNQIPAHSPTIDFPSTSEQFDSKWTLFWKSFASKASFLEYIDFCGNLLLNILFILLVALVPLVLVAVFLFKRYFKVQNNNYNKDSKPLKIFKRLSLKTYYPLKRFVVTFICFIQSTRVYLLIWFFLWALNFNLITILIEFVSWYLYVIMSFDFGSIFIQIHKLVLDLKTIFDIIPIWVVIPVVLVFIYNFSLNVGYSRLYHNERRNRGFLNILGVVAICYGPMGCGKTTQISDMALSTEIQFRDDAFKIILETDMHFPYFPWINFERALRRLVSCGLVYDLYSCRKWVRRYRRLFYERPGTVRLFGYDYARYGLEYNNNLYIQNLWDALEDYACAYFIYTVQSSLLISNYSIREDNLMSDLGNFPLWNTDFFHKDSRLIDSYSRHAHILDQDMLRLGKIMLEKNPNRNAFGFGIYVISEIDKERKNSKTQTCKFDDTSCNQKNDMFNVLLKMSRHACVVANRVFVRIYADLQRPTSLEADGLELGIIINIADKSDMTLLLPWWSPFYVFDLVLGAIKSRFENLYTKYRYNRSDNTLFMYIFKTVVVKLGHYSERITNLFNCQTLSLELESGRQDGKLKEYRYYRMPKKIYSKRFSTNCLSGIFEARAEYNHVGIDDLAEYADIMASNAELEQQNSHFQADLKKYRDNAA